MYAWPTKFAHFPFSKLKCVFIVNSTRSSNFQVNWPMQDGMSRLDDCGGLQRTQTRNQVVQQFKESTT